MTAVAGVVGGQLSSQAAICRAILISQRKFGSDICSVRQSGDACFGLSPFRNNPGGPTAGLEGFGDRWLLCADVRLDDRNQLARDVGCSGKTDTDTGLLLRAWVHWGEDCLNRIPGDFALAVFDTERQTLTLARDISGERPLYFKLSQGRIAFASMPASLASALAPSGVNRRMLARRIHRMLGNPEESYFEGVHRVRAGEVVRLRGGEARRRYYWNPDVARVPRSTGEDYVATYRHLLDSAVASRIQDDHGLLGSHLSSGWDSSAVTTTAARLVPANRLVAFTSAPLPEVDTRLVRHRFADESLLAAGTANMHGLHHLIIRETAPVFESVRRQVQLAQSPDLAPFNAIWWLEIRRIANEIGIRTILTGEFGNLTLNCGGLDVLAAMIRSGAWTQWWREARSSVRQPNTRWRGVLLNSFGPYLPAGSLRMLNRAFLKVPDPDALSFLSPEGREALRQEVTGPNLSRNPYQDVLQAVRGADAGHLRKAALADCGIEERDPMSDRRLIEFALRLPPEQMLRNGELRPMARAALSDRVPQSVLSLTQRGMQGTDWYLRITPQQARDVLESVSAHPLVQDLLDLPKLTSAIDHWPTGDWNSYRSILLYRDSLMNALACGIFITTFDQPPSYESN